MQQRDMLHKYNYDCRPRFNQELFNHNDNDLINVMKNLILSCERDSAFLIKVLGFEVIDDYDEVNHTLWEYEDSIINRKNKSKKDGEEDNAKKKKTPANKKVYNVFDFINLKDSDLLILKVDYFIEIVEKKDGLVNDVVTVYIALPRVVNKYYYRINGNYYSAMYQIVDASTYNNTNSNSAKKKQSITFKTMFAAIRAYRYYNVMKDIDGNEIPCIYYVTNVFKKSVLLLKYMLANFGVTSTISFLGLNDIFIVKDISFVNMNDNYIFPVKGDGYIVIPKIMYDSIPVAQSFVFTIATATGLSDITNIDEIFDKKYWLRSLGKDFVPQNADAMYNKGLSVLDSLNFIYDIGTKNDLKLPEKDKETIFHVLRWIIYEFNSLRIKDNIDISTKKVSYVDYIGALYANKIAKGIFRISDKGDKADLKTIKSAIQIQPLYLIKAIVSSKCQLVNYNNCVNDVDSIIALKYTYKGISGIGEKSNAIPKDYRTIHPSHLGRVDIDSSSNSDPGVSGTLCPLSTVHDSYFMDFEEPNTWESDVFKIMDQYRSMQSKVSLVKLVNDTNLKPQTEQDIDKSRIINQCISINKSLAESSIRAINSTECIPGFDIFGDGLMYYTRED